MTTREALTAALNLLSEVTHDARPPEWLDRFQELLRADLEDRPAEAVDMTDERWHQYVLATLGSPMMGSVSPLDVATSPADVAAIVGKFADELLILAKVQASK